MREQGPTMSCLTDQGCPRAGTPVWARLRRPSQMHAFLVVTQNSATPPEGIWQYLADLYMHLFSDLQIMFLGISSKETIPNT